LRPNLDTAVDCPDAAGQAVGQSIHRVDQTGIGRGA